MYRDRQGVPLLDFIRPLLAMAEFQVNLTLLIWLNENVFWCLFLNRCFKVLLYVFLSVTHCRVAGMNTYSSLLSISDVSLSEYVTQR